MLEADPKGRRALECGSARIGELEPGAGVRWQAATEACHARSSLGRHSQCDETRGLHTRPRGLHSRGLHSCGQPSRGLHSCSLHSRGLHSCGLPSCSLHSCGQPSALGKRLVLLRCAGRYAPCSLQLAERPVLVRALWNLSSWPAHVSLAKWSVLLRAARLLRLSLSGCLALAEWPVLI